MTSKQSIGASMVMGVSKGYSHDAAMIAPEEAQAMVAQKIETLKSHHHDNSDYQIYPGVVVYHEKWGCPPSGEPIAYVSTSGMFEKALEMGKSLQEAFEQTTTSVIDHTIQYGEKTSSFTAQAHDTLLGISHVWQRAAENYYNHENIYASCAFHQNKDETIVLSSELNPIYKEPSEAWEKAIRHIIRDVEAERNIKIDFSFRHVGFTYLRAPDTLNSRGLA